MTDPLRPPTGGSNGSGADDIFAAIEKRRDAIVAEAAAHAATIAPADQNAGGTGGPTDPPGADSVRDAAIDPRGDPRGDTKDDATVDTDSVDQRRGFSSQRPPADIGADRSAANTGVVDEAEHRRQTLAIGAQQARARARARHLRNAVLILALIAAAPAAVAWLYGSVNDRAEPLGAAPSASIAVPPLTVALDAGNGQGSGLVDARNSVGQAPVPLIQLGPNGQVAGVSPNTVAPDEADLAAGLAGGSAPTHFDDPLARAAAAIANGQDPVAALQQTPTGASQPAARDTGLPTATPAPETVAIPDMRRDPLAALRSQADGGDIRAQYDLGLHLLRGTVVDQDDAEAARWLEAAATAGHDSAQYNLGVLYDQGRGVAQSSGEAVRWFRQSAEGNNPKGQYALGVAYARGRGIPADTERAERLFQDAADHDLAEAMYAIGVFREQGINGEQDLTAALEWFQKAARGGHGDAGKVAAELAAELETR